jgi:leader peptidase (prepilin peptidase)/N-methyltransferase
MAIENTSLLEQAWRMLSSGSPLGLIFSLILGACLGSFANVVIWRLPRQESLVRPGSHCPACGAPIPPWRNIPILSYLLLKGRAKCCGAAISPRYPVVELLGALILMTFYLNVGWSWPFLFQSAWMILMIILGAIDLEHFRLPNMLTLTGLLITLIWMIVAPPQSWVSAGWGLVVGVLFASLMLLVGKILAGRWGGFGDFKLIIVLGLTFGPGQFFFFFIISLLLALVWAVYRRGKTDDKRIPMGPAFAFAAWVTFWCGGTVVNWYLGLIGRPY